MKISYKFWYVTREDDIHISEVAVRFYEGDITTKDELIKDEIIREDIIVPVTRYRRFKQLKKFEIKHEKDREHKTDLKGNECLVYTDKDFGVTDDLDDVRLFLNGVLNKDKDRQPEDTQKETKKNKLKLQELK
jgi:hypothetical protein